MSGVSVTVNGKSTSVARGSTVTELIKVLGLMPQTVVVEINGEPLLRDLFGSTELEPDDAIELAHMVGGG